jgi:hypothetical protein
LGGTGLRACDREASRQVTRRRGDSAITDW